MWMKHTVTEGIAETTQEAFDEVWVDLGWAEHEITDEERVEVDQILAAQVEEMSQPVETVVIIHPDTLETTEVPVTSVDEGWAEVGWVRASFDSDGNPILPPDAIQSDTGSDEAQDSPKKAKARRKAEESKQPEAPEEV